ncbi:class I SAM-dependent methyltransferase [Sinorhizobium terangae]|uniref:class I SAM-dependent methyltransferase n=1 Tax=Sinorhizobium terangae TaxID=110322 RepID=UPI0024B1E469|nr:methyltransferase domain-containing protein [Sinorhizobium terangae]WFU50232.1 methyltransferase domain-containing protein [Sinorhizobium terangae]
MGDTIREVLENKIPTDTAAQVDVFKMIDLNKDQFKDRITVLDLGAGTGASYERLKRHIPNIQYMGLDIESSPEVDSRTREDLQFKVYDGRKMPFESGQFDVVFCKQVLEHVRYPDEVIAEVARVIKKGGIFVGSVSQLEPYHSHSIFNWTAYGIVQVLESHGLVVRQLRPGIDGITLTMRRIISREKFNEFFGFESIFNHFIDGNLRKSTVWERNFNKLLIAGHIAWIAFKE